jgi:hypothetical protein
MMLCSMVSCSKAQNGLTTTGIEGSDTDFVVPDVPSMIVDPKDKAEYVAIHYWENYNFSDTTMKHRPAISEPAFSNFADLLNQIPQDKAVQAIKNMLEEASANATMRDYFLSLAERYLYDPNSPVRNEDLYIPVLQYLIAQSDIDEAHKIRPRHQLLMLQRNRVGTVANDFTYTLASGYQGQMHEIKAQYLLLYFNNPDCHDCKRVKEYIAHSDLFIQMTNERDATGLPRLVILGIFPDEDVSLWRRASYPPLILNSYDKGQVINTKELYDLKASPTCYLLDKDKRILLKDVTIEEIENYLSRTK